MYFEVNGKRAFASTGGRPFDSAQPTVLFLHGSGAGPDVWAVQLPRFEGSRAVWLFDPGDGPLPDTPSAAVERVLPAVERMDPPRVLVGHSLGGAVALQLAAAAPGVVDGLVLIATGARLPVPDDVKVSAQVMAQPDPTLADRVIAQLSDGTPLVTRKRIG